MQAVIYARYSSHNQKETSIDDQLRVCNAYADQNDLTVIGVYSDYEQSGRNDKRSEFQRMLKDATKGIFQRVIVYELTRFARNKYESALNKYHLKKYGAKVISATEQIPDSPEGALMETLLEGIAEYQSFNLAKNMMRGKVGIALQCKHTGGRPLLGYSVLSDKTYAVDEEAAVAVRLLFEMYAQGAGYSEIIDTLNARGFLTAAGRTFGKNSLHELLKNERYIGIYSFNKIATSDTGKRNSHRHKSEEDIIRIVDGIPAIIDKEIWERVQKRMEQNKKAPARTKANVNYLLTGKIFCGKCGGAMVGQPSASKSGMYYYYTCCTRKRLRTCDMRPIKKEFVENAVIEYIKAVLTDDTINVIANTVVELQLDNTDQHREIKRMKKQLLEIQKSLDNIMSAIEQGVFTVSTKDRIADLEEQSTNLQKTIMLAGLSTKMVRGRKDVIDWLKSFQEQEANQLIVDLLLKAVYIYDDHLKILCHYGDDDGKKIKISELESCADLPGFDLLRMRSKDSIFTINKPISAT